MGETILVFFLFFLVFLFFLLFLFFLFHPFPLLHAKRTKLKLAMCRSNKILLADGFRYLPDGFSSWMLLPIVEA